MFNNLILEILLILFTIIASNVFIYNLTYFNFNLKNFFQSTKIFYFFNSGFLLMASSPINITLSKSSSSQDMTLV